MCQAHRDLFYNTICWLKYFAQIRNSFVPYHVICIDVSNWIQDDSLFDDSLRLFTQGTAQLGQRLGKPFGTDTANLPTHSKAASAQGSSYP